ncbi:DUF5787 family protein [Halocatena pleomorpha]|uniref:Uncharacterized protein n=1 Tax=Halocatena pleomorpha TaxID=1785090 RepID=A0A3P3R586_9EURY|nr:DUF5787 family protein [Halocatena pleomorpha]RRJ27810.1 hypothetical protein EIK79_17155 [Halocatena pleomorpha]
MREFGFEMVLCGVLEGSDPPSIVSRQLGASTRGRRVVDILTVTPGPAFDARTTITAESIPEAAITADVGVGRFRYWKDCFDCHPDRARRATERAIEIGFFERERRNGRTCVRQTARYPDWFRTLRAIENKPDLDRPGELARQLRTDVSLAVCDEVILATQSHVTGAHLNRIPAEVGVWQFDPDTGERDVIRAPERLPTDAGVEPLDRHPTRTDIAVVSGDELNRLRRQLAERAYGKGWRVPFPSCPHVENRTVPPASTETTSTDGVPYCTQQQRIVRPSDACNSSVSADSDVDIAAIRDRHSPWVRSPTGTATTQSSLARFGTN